MNTPETKAFKTRIRGIDGDKHWVPALFAERLERERDEASKEIEGWRNKWECAVEMAARAENESEEQARLLGMSAEREESVRGKLFTLEKELAQLKEAAKEVVQVWETPPWKIGETPSNAITQLRDAIGYED